LLCSKEAGEAELLDEDAEENDRDRVLETDDYSPVDDDQLSDEGEHCIIALFYYLY